MGQRKDIECEVQRLTDGPKHHLFGFHDLIISNKADTKYLCLEVDTMNRPPLPGELFGVGYVENGRFVKVGETTALNYPQGARQQWVADTNLFTVNNRVGDVWGTDLYDADTNKLLDRFPATAHMLSKDGRYAYGLDYARLNRLGGYGYTGILDKGKNDAVPTSSGITVMDMQTKDVKLLVSVRQAAECDSNGVNDVCHHYLTHLCLSPDSSKLAFLHRYDLPAGGMIDRLMVVNVDGTGLRCLGSGYMSHYHWRDGNTIIIYGRTNSAIDSLQNSKILSNPLFALPIMDKPLKMAKRIVKMLLRSSGNSNMGRSFLMINDSNPPTVTPFAQSLLTDDGHPMVCPSDNKWFVNDTYPDADGIRILMLYNIEKDEQIVLGTFRRLFEMPDMKLKDQFFEGVDEAVLRVTSAEDYAFTRSGLHCDLHPRWNSLGTKVVFDSIHEGTRQVYLIDVSNIIF